MSKNAQIALVVILVLVLGFYYMSTKTGTTTTPVDYTTPPTETVTAPTDTPKPAMKKTVSVNLKPVTNNVDIAQSGTMLLEDSDKGLTVTLKISGYKSSVPQPAHIHTGTCPGVGKVAYPLTNVVDGNSITVLPGVTLASLQAGLPFAVNVHKSAEEVSIYTSCGDMEL